MMNWRRENVKKAEEREGGRGGGGTREGGETKVEKRRQCCPKACATWWALKCLSHEDHAAVPQLMPFGLCLILISTFYIFTWLCSLQHITHRWRLCFNTCHSPPSIPLFTTTTLDFPFHVHPPLFFMNISYCFFL